MQFLATMNLLFLLDSIPAWNTAVTCCAGSAPNGYSSVLGAIPVVNDMDVNNLETQAEKQCRLLWSQQNFQIANEVVSAYLCNDSNPRVLMRRADSLASFDAAPFSEFFAKGPDVTLQQLFPHPTLRHFHHDRKKSFALIVAYRGSDYCGWQTQINNPLPSVQESLEKHLEILQKTRVDVRVCGRTDAGVHAIGQVCRFRTELEVDCVDIQRHLDAAPFSKSFHCLQVQRVSNKFHPGFCTTHRGYVYVLDPSVLLTATKVAQLDALLRELENKTLDYYGFSYGKVKTQSTLCTLYHARAVQLNDTTAAGCGGVCIQLVGNRFLRRMVRLLVSTALQCAFSGETVSLIPMIASLDRTLCSQAAPPGGLILVGAKFDRGNIE